MKKPLIVLMVDPSDHEVQKFQTDDLRATVKSLEDYDLGLSINGGLEDDEVETIVSALEQKGVWQGEDGSRQLYLVDLTDFDLD